MKLIDQLDTKDVSILKALFENSHQEIFITSENLAKLTGRSSRTIKADIKNITQILEKYQVAKLQSEKGKGYRLMPLDRVNYEKMFNLIMANNQYFGYQEKSLYQRKLMILKLLLLKFRVSLDELSELLFINKTTLNKDLNEAKLQLGSWNIETNSSNKGIEIIKYDELNYRLMIVDLAMEYCYPDRDYLPNMDEFNDNLIGEISYFEQIRKRVLNYLRSIDFVMSEYEVNRIPLYLCVAKKRISSDHCICSSFTEFKDYEEYEIAKKLFELGEIKAENENELCSLSTMLFCAKDYDIDLIDMTNPTIQEFMQESEEIYNNFMANTQNYFWSSIFKSDIFLQNKQNLIFYLMRVIVNVKFGNSKAIKLTHNLEIMNFKSSQIATEITRIILYFIQKKYNKNIYGQNFKFLTYLIDKIMLQLDEIQNKKRLLVCSYFGQSIAKLEADHLVKVFGRYIESIKILNFYEFRKENFDDYDFIICDQNIFVNNYPIPCIKYNYMDLNRDTYIFQTLFSTYQSAEIIDKLINITKTITDVLSTDIVKFFKTISLIYANTGQEEELFNSLKVKNNIFPYEDKTDTIFIFIENSFCKNEFIDVYQVENFSKYAFVISLNSTENIKQINMIFDFLKNNIVYVKDLFENIEETYRNVFALCSKRI